MTKDLGIEDAIKHEEELRARQLQERDLTSKAMKNQDYRPKKGWWAPGDYFNTCTVCDTLFIGDKRAGVCADCAYAELESASSVSKLPVSYDYKCVRCGQPVQVRSPKSWGNTSILVPYWHKTLTGNKCDGHLYAAVLIVEPEEPKIWINKDVDPAYACSECGAQCEDLMSPVCFACRQKRVLVHGDKYKRLQARIEKLRWALGRQANQGRVFKKEIRQFDQVIDLATAHIADVSGTCPIDLFENLNWDDCETVCVNESISQDEVMAGCWRRYFLEQAEEGKKNV